MQIECALIIALITNPDSCTLVIKRPDWPFPFSLIFLKNYAP